jgi:hypothetical protein
MKYPIGTKIKIVAPGHTEEWLIESYKNSFEYNCKCLKHDNNVEVLKTIVDISETGLERCQKEYHVYIIQPNELPEELFTL